VKILKVPFGSEDVKLAVVALFGLDEPSTWITFCNDIVPDPKRMLLCYGLHEDVADPKVDEIKWLLSLDALFLAVQIENMYSSSVAKT
jgi:hypothetical protein